MNDTLLGTISATAFNPDLPDPLPVGNTVYTATVSYTPVAGDPDPLTNTVTASGTGADSGVAASDKAVVHHRHHARAGHRRHQVLPGVGAVR